MAAATIKLIVAADEPVLFFSSIVAAENYLEWIDVEDGVYPIAYDPDGNIYRLKTEERKVVIARNSESLPDPQGLNTLLQKATKVISSDNAFLLSLCAKYMDR